MEGAAGGDQNKVRGKLIRPNIECTDGYIHLVDTAMLDDAPPWTVTAGQASNVLKEAVLWIWLIALWNAAL